MTVKYRGKTYKVLADHFCFNFNLYRLASNFSGGASFTALKSECKRMA